MQQSDTYRLVTLHLELSYMTSGASYSGCRFIEVGQGFPDILLGFWVLRWMMSRKVLGNVDSWRQLYLAAKPSHMGGRSGRASLPSALSYAL
jgi:hypothetical protein